MLEPLKIDPWTGGQERTMSEDGWHEEKRIVLAKMQVTKSHDELIQQLQPISQL
jgi:hypothetical protein